LLPGNGKIVKTPRALLFAILLTALVLTAAYLPVEQLMTAIQTWVISHPSSAVFVVTGSIALGILLLLPLSLMFMLAGLLFGLLKGFLVAWVALLLASSAAFFLGQTFARPWIERKIQRNALFSSIDRAVKRKGFLIVMLTRLVMVIPYQLLNYSLGLTRVSFRNAALGTALGSAPSLFLFVYLGTTVSNIAAIMSGEIKLEGQELIIGAVALAIVVGIIALIVRVAGKTLKEELLASTD
jgi:uncharacterized membrane protein YdjX (TVP38/TMEM64 family)